MVFKSAFGRLQTNELVVLDGGGGRSRPATWTDGWMGLREGGGENYVSCPRTIELLLISTVIGRVGI